MPRTPVPSRPNCNIYYNSTQEDVKLKILEEKLTKKLETVMLSKGQFYQTITPEEPWLFNYTVTSPSSNQADEIDFFIKSNTEDGFVGITGLIDQTTIGRRKHIVTGHLSFFKKDEVSMLNGWYSLDGVCYIVDKSTFISQLTFVANMGEITGNYGSHVVVTQLNINK